MIPYIVISLMVFASGLADLVDINPKLRLYIYIALCAMLTLFIGTRLVGPDLVTYRVMYNINPGFIPVINAMAKFTAITRFEPLYLLLNAIFRTYDIDFRWFMFLFSTTFCTLFFIAIKRYSYYYLIALTVFLAYGYISGFSAVRQVMAAALFFYSLKYLIRGQRLIYCLFIVLASLFHASAFILIIFAFVGNIYFSTRTIIIICLVAFITVILGIFKSVAGTILSHIGFLSAGKIDLYLSGTGSLLGTVSILWMAILMLCLIYRSKLEQLDPNFNLFFNVFWIGLAIYAVSVGFGEFGRVVMYFKVSYIVILPLFVRIFLNFYEKILSHTAIGLLCLSFFFTAIYTDTQFAVVNRYIPYKSWLIDD